MLKTICVLAFVLLCVYADIYMHNPRGSNNRNCERNVNRNNANRLFDSENNNAGGYACPRAVGGPATQTQRMYYYVGSELPIEWTAQHGCGNPNIRCEIIVQYMCNDRLRDGTPQDVNDAATTTVPDTADGENNENFGLHESRAHYGKCKTRRRNMGLFTADRRLNGQTAIFTRQNNNGARYGFECAEENEYYPYWHDNGGWKDVAVLVDDVSRCSYFQTESQNVKARGECQHVSGDAPGTGKNTVWPNNQADCEKLGQRWVTVPAYGIAAPACVVHPYSRSNHLGNVGGTTDMARYAWTIPNDANAKCVLRLRYNMSSTDFPININASFNGVNRSPIRQDPYVNLDSTRFLSLAVNTDQYFRTFQDRSYVFEIRNRPASIPATAKIYNLNVRGKRGNIVQTFPSVEYDFVPNKLTVNTNDYVHFQWTGSDYNPRRGCNNGEGGPPDAADGNPALNSRADRSNLVEMEILSNNSPLNVTQLNQKSMFSDVATIVRLAYLGQTDCMSLNELLAITNREVRENHPRNCAKLNSAATPYFDGGAIQLRNPGTYEYMCTRNNNFSNRDQKGVITVVGGTSPTVTRSAAGLGNSNDNAEFSQDPNMVEVDNSNVGDGELMGCDASAIPYSMFALVVSFLAIVLAF